MIARAEAGATKEKKKKKLLLPLLQGISFLRPEGWIGGLTVCWILRGLFASWCRVPDSARAALQEAIENSLTSSLKVTRLRRNGIKSVKGQILCFSITDVRVEAPTVVLEVLYYGLHNLGTD